MSVKALAVYMFIQVHKTFILVLQTRPQFTHRALSISAYGKRDWCISQVKFVFGKELVEPIRLKDLNGFLQHDKSQNESCTIKHIEWIKEFI